LSIAAHGDIVGSRFESAPIVEAKLSGECLSAPDQGTEGGSDREVGAMAIIGGDLNVDGPLEPAVGPDIGLEY